MAPGASVQVYVARSASVPVAVAVSVQTNPVHEALNAALRPAGVVGAG